MIVAAECRIKLCPGSSAPSKNSPAGLGAPKLVRVSIALTLERREEGSVLPSQLTTGKAAYATQAGTSYIIGV